MTVRLRFGSTQPSSCEIRSGNQEDGKYGDKRVVELMAFRHPWRPYQEKVLGAIDLHMADRKLHVVAAPGAGKTILGIEAVRRFGHPALILSPTRSIRDQWVARLHDFLPADAPWPPDWASTQIDNLKFFTSVTYQALHSKYREVEEDTDEPAEADDKADEAPTEDELQELTSRLQKAGIQTLVLDEAHHLRAEWWKALTAILQALPDANLVSLTATPPYDVAGAEWEKYEELCGPIDEEISVPELVKADTLCPHQDYVWMVKPAEKDSLLMKEYDRALDRLFSRLLADPVFRQAVQTHPWISSRQVQAEDILDAPDVAMALLVYLATIEEGLPRRVLSLLDADKDELPCLDRRWWQVLVKSYLFDSQWPQTPDIQKHRAELAKQLRSENLLWRQELRLNESRPVRRKLSLSSSKIDACVDLHRAESNFRGASLRQVVLTDFIRDNLAEEAGAPPLGAWPVFRGIVRATQPEQQPWLALLTGRMAVLHTDRIPELVALTGGAEPVIRDVGLPGFKRILLDSGALTPAFTALLNAGRIRTLTGTRSLLGEGWDAPCINSLVLCSFVGSFMLTNQMRGRAIRVDRNAPDKCASIWHIAAVDPSTTAGLSDLEDLARRFSTFVGLGAHSDTLENGIGRMGLKCIRADEINPRLIDPAENNNEMLKRLGQSADVHARWHKAIDRGSEGRVAPSVVVEKPTTFKAFHFCNTFKYLLYEIFYSFLTGMSYVMQGTTTSSLKLLLWLLLAGTGVGLLVTLPKLIRAVYLLVRCLPVDGSIRQIALALRDALCAARLIETHPRRLPVISRPLDDGSWTLSMDGATFHEQALFADCLREVLGAIENPRYLITRRSLSRHIGRIDYHAVPQVLGVQKERARLFHQAWIKRVGSGELIYTRSAEARKTLLKARAKAFSTAMTERVRRFDRWQ